MTITTNYIAKYTQSLERPQGTNSLNPKSVFDCFTNNTFIKKEEKILPKEALKLILEGAFSQIKTTINQIVKNPIKSLTTAFATTGILFALPLIGIPTAVGGSVLALGFAGISTCKLIKNTHYAIKNNKNGEYNKARANLKQIGNASLDLAVSLPFVPKSISTVKEFTKYGKIGINIKTISKLVNAKNPKEYLNIVNEANTNLKKNYNYTQVVDKKLKEWNLPETESKAIRQELLDFNVPEDEIAEVVVRKIAEHKGQTTIPYIVRRQLTEGTRGSYSPYAGILSLPDKTKQPLPMDTHGSRQIPRKPGKLSADGTHYIFEMIDTQTNKIFKTTAPKKVIEDYTILQNDLNRLTPQAREISTIVHEFEHFDQHSKIVRLKGIYEKCSRPAKELYTRVINEKGRIKPDSLLAKEAEKYLSVNHAENSNYIKYLQNALEVGARKAQANAIKSHAFKRLDSVFKELPPLEQQNIFETLIPSIIQEEIAKV